MLENLLQQREELLEKIRRIAETCEGIENEANAQRVTELNGRQAELLAQKDELKAKLSALDGELGSIGKNIQDLSGSGLEKILQAIKNQRWFFFKNKSHIMFDKTTGLLWPNLNYFNIGAGERWGQCTGRLSGYYNCDFIKDLKIDDIENWELPLFEDINRTLNDNTFPFYYNSSNNCCIKTNYRSNDWYIYSLIVADGNNNHCIAIDRHPGGFDRGNRDSGVFPKCQSLIEGSEYLNNISPSNNFYTETEKLQFTLNIFVQNDLIPMFDDAEITQLYRKIFVDKPALLKQLAEVETQIAEAGQVKLTANFNYKPLLAKYDVAATAKSPIKYFDAVLAVSDEFLDILNEYETAQAETIAAFLKIALKLKAKYTDNPNLTPEENALLADRQKFLATRLELATDEPKRKILVVKAQANNFFTRLEEVNAGDNSISDLAALQAEPRVDFELLVENMARIVLDTQRRVDFFAENKNFVASVVNSQAHWSDDYKAFKTSLREELAAACRNDAIEDEIFSAWYDDWQVKRFAIEQRFLRQCQADCVSRES